MKLIEATILDVPRIIPCAREFTSILPDCPLNPEWYVKCWKQYLVSQVGNIFLLEENGEVVGGIGGIVHPDLLTSELQAVELFWYVKPAYRRGTWPVRLLKAFERWAKEKGCTHVAMIHMEASMPERLKEFYTRSGYSLLETVYRKRV